MVSSALRIQLPKFLPRNDHTFHVLCGTFAVLNFNFVFDELFGAKEEEHHGGHQHHSQSTLSPAIKHGILASTLTLWAIPSYWYPSNQLLRTAIRGSKYGAAVFAAVTLLPGVINNGSAGYLKL